MVSYVWQICFYKGQVVLLTTHGLVFIVLQYLAFLHHLLLKSNHFIKTLSEISF